MDERVQLELRGRQPSEVVEIVLDGCRASVVSGLTDTFTSLNHLSINSVGLTSLEGFPPLSSLQKLELSDNKLSGTLQYLSGCKKLKTLILSGNRIKDWNELKPLAQLDSLWALDLYGNRLTSDAGYRERVFSLIPHLVFLDALSRVGEDQPDEDEDDADEESEDDYETDNEPSIGDDLHDQDDDGSVEDSGDVDVLTGESEEQIGIDKSEETAPSPDRCDRKRHRTT